MNDRRTRDQQANQHMCAYRLREANRIGREISREAGEAATLLYWDQLWLQQQVTLTAA